MRTQLRDVEYFAAIAEHGQNKAWSPLRDQPYLSPAARRLVEQLKKTTREIAA